MEQIIASSELELILKFDNPFQVEGYKNLLMYKNKQLELTNKREMRELEVKAFVKTTLRITTIISTLASALAIVLESVLPIL